MGVLHNFSLLPQNIGNHAVFTASTVLDDALSVSLTFNRHTAPRDARPGLRASMTVGVKTQKAGLSSSLSGLIGRVSRPVTVR